MHIHSYVTSDVIVDYSFTAQSLCQCYYIDEPHGHFMKMRLYSFFLPWHIYMMMLSFYFVFYAHVEHGGGCYLLSWFFYRFLIIETLMAKVLSSHELAYDFVYCYYYKWIYYFIPNGRLIFDAHAMYCIFIVTIAWSIHLFSWRPCILCHIIVLVMLILKNNYVNI